ncbi:uncharacterized protein RJT21DRAFT_29144 [Scheffersomyces amazonensis]|uniref:uncharacterized protein n=1 Tax=Scheffersomyces amazonensis TaxID=1078765 RepID=UPI00315CBB02
MSDIVSKMSMGGMSMGGGMGGSSSSPKPSCKISMLWNWYTVDTCFIARSWHVRSKGMFAGSCIGVFLLVVAAQWLNRFARELDRAFAKQNAQRRSIISDDNTEGSSSDDCAKDALNVPHQSYGSQNPIIFAVTQSWLFRKNPNDITATPFQHLIRSGIFMVEWGLSYLIMLLFMYYNGYIIISCILGALFGKFIFTFTESIESNDSTDRKCCK